MTYAAAALGINVTSTLEISGGTLSSDATYYYRTFTSTDNLIISNQSLAVEYLVVAGGGAGGIGGGGGAGGVRNGNATLIPGTYLAQVGAGGSGGQNPAPSNGSNSSFNSLVSTGGGCGPYLGNAANGGSGGGGTSFGSPYDIPTRPASAGTGIVGQGNNGGTYSGNREYGAGGGGGGAGGAGSAATGGTSPSGTGGVGGIGTNSYSTWATATGTGQSGYYGGGGGGGNNGTAINPATWSGSPSAATISTAWTSSSGGFGQGGGAAGGLGGGGSGGARYGSWAGTQLGWQPFSSGDPRDGSINTGGGGGGWGSFYAADAFFYQGVYYASIGGTIFSNGAGGSGIVIIRYLKSAVGG